MNRQEEMRQQVTEFHYQHPEVWHLFVQFTFQMIDRGYKNYSVNAIFERIRWEKDSVGGDGVTSFKLNNNYRALYSASVYALVPRACWFLPHPQATLSYQGGDTDA
jgi:hypothetical protein